MTQRILDKLEEYLQRGDLSGAERHLLYWLQEFASRGDWRGETFVCNELMGFFRKQEKEEKAFFYGQRALGLIETHGVLDNLGAGTTYLNFATVCKAFGRVDEALSYFQRAEAIYATLPENDARLGGLYNNMALALCDAKRFSEARAAYEKALAHMATLPDGAGKCAITLLNLAELAEAEQGLEEASEAIEEYLAKAKALLDTISNETSAEARFLFRSCATVFGYYGHFDYERILTERGRTDEGT